MFTPRSRRPARRPRYGARPRLEAMESRALLATFTVTSLADAGPGTLREAIERANLDPDRDAIAFEPGLSGTIELSTALPALATDLSLLGPGASALTVARGDGPGTPLFRIFTVPRGADVSISGLTIAGGLVESEGGGVLNEGSLAIDDAIIKENAAYVRTYQYIPGCAVRCSIDPLNCVCYVEVRGETYGGGIANRGTLALRSTELRGNVGSGLDNHGGVVEASDLIVAECGGSSQAYYFAMLRGVTNRGGGTLVLEGAELTRNRFGGLDNQDGSVTIRRSVIAENDGYGISNWAVSETERARVALTESTIRGNSGGIWNGGSLAISSSTISGNTSAAFAGGIRNDGDLSLSYATIANNAGWEGVDGIANGGEGTTTIRNSILAVAPGGISVANEGGVVRSEGNNVFSDSPAIPLAPTDLIDTDALLGPLADNGGPTPTHALLPGSPAIDAAAPIPGLTADQRGIPRPQGAAPDIGAFEVEVPILPMPRVVSLQRLGYHARPTRLVLTFDASMDPARAGDPANYRLVTAGRDRVFGTPDDRPLAIGAATYDEALRSVTLATGRRLPLHRAYRLTVVGTPPAGLTSGSGVPLDGDGTGDRDGSDYEATFGREALLRPAREARAARIASLRQEHQERREALLQRHRERQAALEARRTN